VFPGQAMTLAAIDRLVHHATILSSGFQSEIQVLFRALIVCRPLFCVRGLGFSSSARCVLVDQLKSRSLMERFSAPPDSGVACRPVVGPSGVAIAGGPNSNSATQGLCQDWPYVNYNYCQ
jgi:hypothetical protein